MYNETEHNTGFLAMNILCEILVTAKNVRRRLLEISSSDVQTRHTIFFVVHALNNPLTTTRNMQVRSLKPPIHPDSSDMKQSIAPIMNSMRRSIC